MRTHRVEVGKAYIFQPVTLDRIDSRVNSDVKQGDTVRVINIPGAPKANTAGHCHIQTMDGKFAGLVHTNSLVDPENLSASIHNVTQII